MSGQRGGAAVGLILVLLAWAIAVVAITQENEISDLRQQITDLQFPTTTTMVRP